ncbi:hypothetical protein TH24_20525 [Thalassospira xiamenensis]|nr:hypothetical protein TH24_20525 [Thalassospira xiamenensis]
MPFFHIGINETGTEEWTDLPTIWIGAPGAGKSARFFAHSCLKCKETGPCMIIDAGGQTDIITGKRLGDGQLPMAEREELNAHLIEEAIFMTDRSVPILIDEPRGISGYAEKWDKQICELILENRPVGLTYQPIGLLNCAVRHVLHKCVMVCIPSGDKLSADLLHEVSGRPTTSSIPKRHCLVSLPAWKEHSKGTMK